jgi:threonine dehydrogenase-like Zn-dependent dehydrogenase
MRCIPFEEGLSVAVFGGGIIGVLNSLVAKARRAKEVTILDVSQERLDLLKELELPIDHFVNSRENDPVDWTCAQRALQKQQQQRNAGNQTQIDQWIHHELVRVVRTVASASSGITSSPTTRESGRGFFPR